MSDLPNYALHGAECDLLHLADLVDDELRWHGAVAEDRRVPLTRIAAALATVPRRTFRSHEKLGVEITFEDLPVLRTMLGALYLDKERLTDEDDEQMTVGFEDWIFSNDGAIKQLLGVSVIDRLGKLA